MRFGFEGHQVVLNTTSSVALGGFSEALSSPSGRLTREQRLHCGRPLPQRHFFSLQVLHALTASVAGLIVAIWLGPAVGLRL
jgi:hypothetical protein